MPKTPIDPSSEVQASKVVIVDSSILQHVLDLLCTLLKKSQSSKEQFKVIIQVFPQILEYVNNSDDMFMLLHGTAALKSFICIGHAEILQIVTSKRIIEVAKKLLSPTLAEQAALMLGGLIIYIFHRIEPKIDTNLLMSVVWKIYKSRMPSIVQTLVLIFARLILSNPNEIVTFLTDTSIDNRISLKIVLDKWLLQ